LSATTGQDGISIGIGISKVEIDKIYVHDNNGLAAGSQYGYTPGALSNAGSFTTGTYTGKNIVGVKAGSTASAATAGALAIDGITITANYDSLLSSRNLMDLEIDSSGSTDGAFLNIAAAVSGLDIKIGKISVARSNTGAAVTATDSIRRGVVNDSEKAIL